ncbi:hypothetical protein EAF04_003225 [Stromatinia cepivora]|nr:hypothetical protein EAF04_003225 [Stromatinia cepivora]
MFQDSSIPKGLVCREMEEEELEEGEWTGEPQRNSTFKAFALTTLAVRDETARLAKVEVWKQEVGRQKVRGQLMGRVEAPSSIQTARVLAPSASSARSTSLVLSASPALPTPPAPFASSASPASLAPPAAPTSSAPPTKAELKRASRWVQRHAKEGKYKMKKAAAKAQREKMEAASAGNSKTGNQYFKARGQSLTLAAPPPPLSPRSIHNIRQGSVDSDTTDMVPREREHVIDDGMYGDTYGDMYGAVYWDANLDIYEENLVSGGPSRANRRNTKRYKKRKKTKARELQASLQGHGLIPVPPSQQSIQEGSARTVSDHDTAALNLNPSDKQQNGRGDEENGKTVGESSSSGTQPQNKRQEQIDASRQRIMALQASLHAKGLLPVSASWLLVQENLSRPLSDPPTAALNQDSDTRQQERGQETQGNMDEDKSSHGTGPRKKLREQNTVSQDVMITAQQAGLQEQELKPHAASSTQQKVQNAFAQNVLGLKLEIDVETNGETDVGIPCSGDTLHEKRVKQSNDPLKTIRIHQADMQENREKKSGKALQHKLAERDNGELGGKSLDSGTGSQKKHIRELISERKEAYQDRFKREERQLPEEIRLLIGGDMEQRQRLSALSAPEDISLSKESTKSETSANIRDAIRERINRKIVVAKRAALQKQSLQLHATSSSQQFVQENLTPFTSRSLEVPQLENGRELHNTETSNRKLLSE